MFEIGERVNIVLPNVSPEYLNALHPDMLAFNGLTFIIRGMAYGFYQLEGCMSASKDMNDNGYWLWKEEWLEKAQSLVKEI